jgi:hypothetical protein
MIARLAGLVGGPEDTGHAPTAEEEAEARAKLAGLRALRDQRVGEC